jgi:uncharacterized protein YjbI with pentapeptide repeats/beta-lactamase regulating signal transducer with metallopeptidase domain
MNALEIVAASLGLSVVASGFLAAGCALLARVRRLRAGVAQWMWFAALVATALLPIAGGLSALARSHAAPADVAAPVRVVVTSAGEAAPRDAGRGARLIRETAEPAGSPAVTGNRNLIDRALPAALGIAALGAIAGAVNVIVSLLRLRAIKRRSTPLDEALSHDLPWLAETTEGRETYLRLSYEIETPMAIGFGRPVILIPTDLANENGLSAIESLVIHEHAHLRHYDDYTNLVQRLIERLNWFNPFVWYMGRELTLAREMSADDAVIEQGNDSADYAQTLWRMAREMRMPTQPIVAPGAFFTRKQISQRIEAIMSANRGQLSPMDPTAVVVGLTLAFIAYGLVAMFTPSYEYRVAQAAVPDLPSIASIPAMPSIPPVPAGAEQTAAQIAEQTVKAAAGLATQSRGGADPDPHAVPTIPPSALGYLPQSLLQRVKAKLDDVPAARQPGGRGDASDQAMRCNSGCDLSDKDFSGKNLDNSSFSGSDLSNVNFRNASLRNAGFEGSTLDGAQFRGANLAGARFNGASIDGVHFEGANLQGASFQGTDLTSAHFDNAAIRNILASGCSGCDLSGIDARGIDLSGLEISGTNLSDANLSGANLRGARLSGVNLSSAKLDGADLTGAELTGCDLSDASTKNAKLEHLTLRGTSLN